jgi:NhaA family Na+:H+ antiporter
MIHFNDNIKPTPVEKYIISPVSNFIGNSATSGIVLFVAAVLAVIVANSSLATSYHHFFEQTFGFSFNETIYLNMSLHHWINDGLMAVFFFVVGLELKREIIGGELSSIRKSALPIAAAVGGMLVPAAIYLMFNAGQASEHGWGIPMATDIAFALGVLYLLGDRIPNPLKVFLTALAIADDLGAVLVIALFYTEDISIANLGIGIGFLVILFMASRIGVRNSMFYGLVGVFGVWLFFLMSGVHATIAAVLLAFVIPANSRINEITFSERARMLLGRFRNLDINNSTPTLTNDQLHILDSIKKQTDHALTPLQKLEHKLHPFVAFIVLPIFAFANAGVTFSDDMGSQISSPVALGVIMGLLIGKVLGIIGISTLMLKLKIAELPAGLTKRHLIGVSFLAAIGFTMSLFVTNLAFKSEEFVVQAKIGIFIASLLGGFIGYLILAKTSKSPQY